MTLFDSNLEIDDLLVWEHLKNKEVDKLFVIYSNEHHSSLKEKIIKIKYNFFYLFDFCSKLYEYFKYGDFDEFFKRTKEDLSEHLSNNFDENIHKIIFNLWDENFDEAINSTWEVIKPKNIPK